MKPKYLLTPLCVAFAASAQMASAAIILAAESFGTSGNLNGSTADTFAAAVTTAGGSATWVSRGTIYGQNGSVATTGSTAVANESSAYLNLGSYINAAKGTATGLFTLQATINKPTGSGSSGWISAGFLNGSNVNLSFTTSGVANVINRVGSSTGNDYFSGPGAGGTNYDAGVFAGNVTFTILLDLTPLGGWNGTTNFGKVTFSNSENAFVQTHTYTANNNFGSVGFSTGAFSTTTTGAVSNFSLSQVPEPRAAVIGGLGILGLLRRRRA